MLLLLVGAAIAAALGEWAEAIAILAALLLNAAIGFLAEWRARVSLARLRALAVPHAIVRRDGQLVRIAAAGAGAGRRRRAGGGRGGPGRRAPAAERGPAGRRVRPSPARAPRCGRTPTPGPAPDGPLAERANVVHLGTAVLAGSGLALVTATGPATELGRIGQLVASTGRRATPLERQVEALGRRLIVLALGICAVVGLAGILHGEPIGLMLETAISLAVAAVPEGLPAVVSLALAAGLWRLAAPRRAGAAARGGGDPRLHHRDLRRQDRHHDREPDDGDHGGAGRASHPGGRRRVAPPSAASWTGTMSSLRSRTRT